MLKDVLATVHLNENNEIHARGETKNILQNIVNEEGNFNVSERKTTHTI